MHNILRIHSLGFAILCLSGDQKAYDIFIF